MIQIEIGIDPVIAHLGPLALRWYSLAIIVAIVVAVVIVKQEFARKRLDLRAYDTLVFWTVFGGIAGARLLHVVDHPERFVDNPLQIFALQEGGLAIYGAVIGGFTTVALLSRVHALPFRAVIDAIAPGLVLAQAIGRFGCIVNGDAWGRETSGPLAFVYTNPAAMLPRELLNVPTHPYPLYDMALNLGIFAVLWGLRRRRLPDGMIFALFVALYAPGRFLISFVREERVWFAGLQEAQVIAVVGFALALTALFWLRRRSTIGAPAAGATVAMEGD